MRGTAGWLQEQEGPRRRGANFKGNRAMAGPLPGKISQFLPILALTVDNSR